MNTKHILLLIITAALSFAQNINPYHVLQLEQGATEDEVRSQYKALKKSVKDNKIKQLLYEDAYKQIMIDSTLDMTLSKEEKKPQKQTRRNKRRRRGLPRFSDMFRQDYFAPQKKSPKEAYQRAFEAQDKKNYAEQIKSEYEYQLPPQYDDPSYYHNQKQTEQLMKNENIAFNKKAAGYILFFAGILLKLAPCICIFLICKYRRQAPRKNQSDEINPIQKAINGWTGKNRRQHNKKNK